MCCFVLDLIAGAEDIRPLEGSIQHTGYEGSFNKGVAVKMQRSGGTGLHLGSKDESTTIWEEDGGTEKDLEDATVSYLKAKSVLTKRWECWKDAGLVQSPTCRA